jgi:hypothetical protein
MAGLDRTAPTRTIPGGYVYRAQIEGAVNRLMEGLRGPKPCHVAVAEARRHLDNIDRLLDDGVVS